MNLWAFLADGVAVTIFGSVLAAAFCEGLNIRKNCWILCGFIAVTLILQGFICYVWSIEILRLIYPLVIHIPLALLLCVLTKKKLWPVVAVLIAYLCCQLRRWFALLFVAIVGGSSTVQAVAQVVITVPLLLLLMRIAVPAVQKVASKPVKLQMQFGILPFSYYVFDYLFVVYTDLLVSGGAVVVEFMPFLCCGAYLLFLFYHAEQERKKFQLQQANDILDVQIKQSVREIHALRESQTLAKQYRHDLRHHLQYISACIGNGQSEQAKEYIAGICHEIENQKVNRYCDNEAINLILSAFVARAKEKGIAVNIQNDATVSKGKLTDSDLCVLLSNALENAIHACCPLATSGMECVVEVIFYEKAGKFFLQVTNPCREGVLFENGVPVSHRPGHGIGVQSICTIVDRYEGVYFFGIQGGRFVLRVSL